MRRIILTALITCLAVGTATAQSCDSKAVSANGKPLHGAAKMSFVKKCKRDACGSKAMSAEGKPLSRRCQEQFYDEVHEGCLERLAAVQPRQHQLRPPQSIDTAGRQELALKAQGAPYRKHVLPITVL